jgi:hypothetical protein
MVAEYHKKNEAKNLDKIDRYLRNLARGGPIAEFKADLMLLGVPFDVDKIRIRYKKIASEMPNAPRWETLS